ncbi:unnamed protein product, partial [marine sediment metagenome]
TIYLNFNRSKLIRTISITKQFIIIYFFTAMFTFIHLFIYPIIVTDNN